MIEVPAHACRFVQSYSSWSCSPAELRYASDCGAKVQSYLCTAKKLTMKCGLQFELLTTNFSKLACKMSYTPNISCSKFVGKTGNRYFCGINLSEV